MATVIDSLYFQYHYIFSVSVMASNNIIGIAEMKRATTMNWLFESWEKDLCTVYSSTSKKGFLFCGLVHTDILLLDFAECLPVIIYKQACCKPVQTVN